MPGRNYYVCEVCGLGGEYWAGPSTRPTHCGQTMTWMPLDAPAVDAYEPFQEFDVQGNRGETHHIDSLAKLRAVERAAEQQSRNGEGQPMIWRDYSQNRSNFDQHTLATHLDRPVDGYAGGIESIDTKKFRKRIGDAVRQDHGDA